MTYGLRLSVFFTAACWLAVLLGVFVMAWCGRRDGINLVLGVGPAALVGSIASYVEWKSWRDHSEQ